MFKKFGLMVGTECQGDTCMRKDVKKCEKKVDNFF